VTAFSVVNTTSHAVSGVATTFTPSVGADPNILDSVRPIVLRLWSDTPCNIRVGGGDATFDDLPLAAGVDGLLLSIPPGQSVSVVKQTSESDGTLWASVIKRQ